MKLTCILEYQVQQDPYALELQEKEHATPQRQQVEKAPY